MTSEIDVDKPFTQSAQRLISMVDESKEADDAIGIDVSHSLISLSDRASTAYVRFLKIIHVC